MPKVPPRNHPMEGVYPPTKTEELPGSNLRIDGYRPVKEAVGGDSEEKAGKHSEQTAYEELDMLRGGHRFEGNWSKHTKYEDRERRSSGNL